MTYSEPIIIVSLRQVVVVEKIMMDFLGDNYNIYEIREANSAHLSSKEVPMVQPFVQ